MFFFAPMLNDDFELSIPKETLASMPIVTYPGEITVIDSAIDTVKALRFLSSLPLVGFDTETKPNFRPGRTNNVALIQIYSPNRCFLFRINKTGLTDEMVRFLESKKTVKVGVSLHDDFRNLNKIRQVNPHAEIDLQQLVKRFHIRDNSLQRIYAIVFEKRISKSQRLTNWEAPQLNEKQQIYASIDAWACYKLYTYLSAGLFHPEKSAYIAHDDQSSSPTP